MIKMGLITPIHFLDKYYALPSLHLCYGSLVAVSPRYRDFHRKRSVHPDSTVILDHSPLVPRRLRGPYTSLLLAMESVRPDYVVLPSSDHSSRSTLRLSKAFLSKYNNLIQLYKIQTIGLIQGYDLEDLKRCYQELKGLVNAVGLPENIERLEPRNEVVRKLNIRKPFFFFEVYQDPFEEVPESRSALGVVTSMPLRLAYVGRSLTELNPTPPPLDFFLETEPLPALAKRNVQQYTDYIRGC